MISTHVIQTKLQTELPQADVEVIDTKGDGYHFQINITCSELIKLPPVAQHRTVYQALGTELTQAIHAISIKISSSV